MKTRFHFQFSTVLAHKLNGFFCVFPSSPPHGLFIANDFAPLSKSSERWINKNRKQNQNRINSLKKYAKHSRKNLPRTCPRGGRAEHELKKSEQQPKKMKFMFYYLMNLPQIKPRVAPLRSPYSALRIESKPTPCLQLICKKCQDQRLLLSQTRHKRSLRRPSVRQMSGPGWGCPQ